jgi:short-subunit dehydrogenase
MLAVVTGASSGIGATFARQLAARGWDLLLIARREDRLRELASYLSGQYKISAQPMPADLTDPAALAAIAAHIRQAPDLGLLVNNAGFGTRGYFFETDPDSLLRMHRLHVDATVSLTQAAVANLIPRAKKGTGVINVSSVAAFLPAATYGATKTWVNAFTECIANELAAMNSPVTVQALCPGYTLTEFHDVIGQDRSAIPSWLWLPPDFVVAESLRGFDRGRLIVVPGWRYKLMAAGARLLPAALRRRTLLALVPRYQKPK